MTSTFSPSLRLTLQADGDNQNLWGAVANSVFTMLETAIAGVTTVNVSGSDVTLTTVQGGNDQARAAVLVLTGIVSGNVNVIVPPVTKGYWVVANFTVSSTGGPGGAVTIKAPTGTGAVILSGSRNFVFCDGTNVLLMSGAPNVAQITSGTITGLSQPLPISAGGTGATSVSGITTTLGLQDAAFTTVSSIVAQASGSAGAGTVSSAGGTFTGNVTVSKTNVPLDGSAAVNGQITLSSSTEPRIGFSIPNVGSAAIYFSQSGDFRIRYGSNSDVPVSIPIGGIIEWSGQLSSLPPNYQACDGTNGTPDLRDRFIVAAGGSYAVGSSGGGTTATTSTAGVTLSGSGSTDTQGAHNHSGAVGSTTLTLTQIPGHTHSAVAPSPTFATYDSGNLTNASAVSGVGQAAVSTGSAGGSTGHSHTISTDGGHNHAVTISLTGSGNHNHTVSITPPFFALFKIMRKF